MSSLELPMLLSHPRQAAPEDLGAPASVSPFAETCSVILKQGVPLQVGILMCLECCPTGLGF